MLRPLIMKSWTAMLFFSAAFLAAPSLPRVYALRTVQEITDASSIWQWVASAAMFLAFIAVVFKNSKRAHDT